MTKRKTPDANVTESTKSESPKTQSQVVPPAKIQEAIARGDSRKIVAYVDALVYLSVGPYVCKTVFAEMNVGNSDLQSLVTINIPTKALLDAAANILKAFAQDGFKSNVTSSTELLLKSVSGLKIGDGTSQ